MHLLARQEQDISRGDGRLGPLRPYNARAVQEDQRFFVEMPVRLRLGKRDVADKLRHHRRAMLAIDQHLVVALGHLVALRGIDRRSAVRILRFERRRHLV